MGRSVAHSGHVPPTRQRSRSVEALDLAVGVYRPARHLGVDVNLRHGLGVVHQLASLLALGLANSLRGLQASRDSERLAHDLSLAPSLGIRNRRAQASKDEPMGSAPHANPTLRRPFTRFSSASVNPHSPSPTKS